MSIEDVTEEFRKRLGNANILSAAQAMDAYPMDSSGYQTSIAGALLPPSADLIPSILQLANQHKIPLYTISTGHNWGYGAAQPVVPSSFLLDLSRLTNIRMLDAASGLVRVEPGVTQQMLANFLVQHQLDYMVPTTGAGPNASILGNALEKGFGLTPIEDHFGAVTKIEAVLADGSLYQSALTEMGAPESDAVFKWGLGPYLDGLMAQGNFAVVTAITIALAPRPSSAEAYYFYVPKAEQMEQALVAVRELLQLLPGVAGAVNLMNQHRQLSMLIPYPKESAASERNISAEKISLISEQHKLPAWLGYGTLYGDPLIVKAAKKIIRKKLRVLQGKIIFVNRVQVTFVRKLLAYMPMNFRNAWEFKLDATLNALNMVEGKPTTVALPLAYWRSGNRPDDAKRMDPAKDGCGLIWYAPLTSTDAHRVRLLVDLIVHTCEQHAIEPLITLSVLSARHIGCTVPIIFDRNDAAMTARARALYDALFERGRALGFLPYRIGADKMHYFRELAPVYAGLCGRIKKTLDPNNILSPGRYNVEKW